MKFISIIFLSVFFFLATAQAGVTPDHAGLTGATIMQAGVTAATLNASRKTILTSSLVGLWTLDGADISGTTATDQSGSGVNGTITNGPVPVIGKIGQGLSFDGVDDYVDFGDYQILANGTVTFWANVSILSGTPYLVSKVKSGANHGEWRFYVDSASSNKITFTIESLTPASTTTITSNSGITASQWYFFAATWQSGVASSQAMYIDGVKQTSTATPGCGMEVTGVNLNIARNNALANSYLVGSMDEVRVYSRALSDHEILLLYDQGQ